MFNVFKSMDLPSYKMFKKEYTFRYLRCRYPFWFRKKESSVGHAVPSISGEPGPGQVRSGQVRSGQVRSGPSLSVVVTLPLSFQHT